MTAKTNACITISARLAIIQVRSSEKLKMPGGAPNCFSAAVIESTICCVLSACIWAES